MLQCYANVSKVYYINILMCFVSLDINATVDTSCGNGDVRLVGGANYLEGRVEMCYNKLWGSVCHRSWDTADANVVCEQLGHQPTGTLICAFRERYRVQ